MTLHFYAVRVEEHRVVAAEVDAWAAAALLESAHPLLLGTAEDLSGVARRFQRPLVSLARAERPGSSATLPGARESSPADVPAARPQPLAPAAKCAGLFRIAWRAGRAREQDAARVA